MNKAEYFSTSSTSRLRLTARLAISISLLATLVLLISLFILLKDQPENNYLEFIQSLTRSQDQLTSAMLIGASIIIIMAGLITWLIMLYSSARVAGPLYRFSKNIELEIEYGPVATIKLRDGDNFQDLSKKLASTADELNQYYGKQLKQIDKLYSQLESAKEISAEQYQQHLQQIKNIVGNKSL